MTRADDVETFRNLLTAVTELVGDEYFLLPVADQNGGEPIIQYRERVYSYELYHQIDSRVLESVGFPDEAGSDRPPFSSDHGFPRSERLGSLGRVRPRRRLTTDNDEDDGGRWRPPAALSW